MVQLHPYSLSVQKKERMCKMEIVRRNQACLLFSWVATGEIFLLIGCDQPFIKCEGPDKKPFAVNILTGKVRELDNQTMVEVCQKVKLTYE